MVHYLLAVAATAAAAVAIPPAAPTVSIAKDVDLPMVALGTGSGQKGAVANATALWLGPDCNGVAIDTSIVYKDETEIREGLARVGVARGDVFLETKLVTRSDGYEGDASVAAEVADNLDQLGVSYVDLTLIHFPGTAGANRDAWAALEAALAANETRSIGVSNFSPDQLAELKKTATIWPPAVNQLELSVSYHDDAALEYNKNEGIVVQAYSPLCGGFNGSSCTAHGGKNVLTVPEVIATASKYDVSAARVGLKWIVQQGFPLATATWDLDYMNEDLDLWSFTLADDDMALLSSVYTP
mmetsp:Transcript_8207/g.25744  ORF Transcript_8207/g.25744 Transcript_8207/m.25744 type:complete len:299 (-) Transcript_8207:25-921(-)